jgi:hypothetical protein
VCAAVKPVDIIDEVSLEWEVLRWRDRTIILFEMFWQNEAKKLNIFWGLWGWVGSCLRSMRWIGANPRSEGAISLLAAHDDSRRPLCLWCRVRSGRDQHRAVTVAIQSALALQVI